MKQLFTTRGIVAGAVITVLCSTVATAHHSWRKYHWATTTGIVSLEVGDNVDPAKWGTHLGVAITDWNVSANLDLTRVPGGTNPATCAPTAGRIETCNAAYGTNGWLGIAQIWIQGSAHIYQATTRLNDTYFNTATYNTPAWRQLVTCQEVGHDFGLDHQDERNNNVNLGTCMDYTSDPNGFAGGASSTDPSNEHPNQHDYDQLASIYSHKDSTGTAGASSASRAAARPEAADWGQLVRTNPDNRVQTYERDLGNGNRVVTHVFWADPEGDAKPGRR